MMKKIRVVVGAMVAMAGITDAIAADGLAPCVGGGDRRIVVGLSDQQLQKNLVTVESPYREAFEKAGYLPLVIPCTTNAAVIESTLDRIGLLVLTGGADVDPARYGARRLAVCGEANLMRDAFEFELIAAARRRRMPIVGICRGAQILNVAFGGTLWQDLPSEWHGMTNVNHGTGSYMNPRGFPAAHTITPVAGSRLATEIGTDALAVNSHHHQAVKKPAPGFRVAALAPDGVIEAIESDEYPAFGIQCHPEALVARAEGSSAYDMVRLMKLFRAFPNLAFSDPASNAGEKTESRMDRSKLQIGTYYLHPVAQTEAHVKAMKECGVDFVFGVDAGRREALDLLAKYGIGCVATGVFPGWGGGDGRFAGQLEKKYPLDEYVKAAKGFKDHPAIWMVDVGDEPSALEFPYYARLIPEVRKHLPKGVVPYLNLYPNYAQVTKNTNAQQLSQLGTATYGEHIERYAAAIPLDYLSYDFYVYSAPASGFDAFLTKMYDNFETVAASCRKTGRSFWYIPQVNNVYETYHMSPNRLRFQAFTALAYGAEVINWACWMKGWWVHNIVNPDGTVNEYEYLILKTVNRELHALGQDYMRYRNVATHRLGFGGNAKSSLDLAAFTGISVAEGGRLVVGEMNSRTGEGTAFLAVASDDPHDAGARQKTLVFKPTGAFKVLRSMRTKCPQEVKPGADGIVRLPLASAEAILVMTK